MTLIIDAEAKRPDHSWVTPDESLLEDRRGELPEFPCGVFPPPLSSWLLRAARGAGVRIDHIAVPMLGVASSLIGKARRSRLLLGLNQRLWACIIGQSGDRKTRPPSHPVLDRIEGKFPPSARLSTPICCGRSGGKALKAWRKAARSADREATTGTPRCQ